ncbi:protocatechuate 3,4-dioxygenase subunit alpha [Salinibacterium sp. SYSU T00001]|uniref:protocatechuate 3,4-dioxygenase subunit alpha n=1 Tax=Homoserinimonas sedimenticola TaxID=2986805 RepID=UPI0022368BC5|nr:protocatechuate 3,4-dioxygenase subunit alpha [Salinibacterium sedimenticola]MCW4386673.1 protocatechuate 3,4-dioxygenase subunit alpha [Salinibacterium sedimenticola]
MTTLAATPGQTVGPFYGYALPFEGGESLVDRSHPAAVRLYGRVFDGNGAPIPDALVEIWQADEQGRVPAAEGSLRRDGYTFTGFGRAAVDDNGMFSFTTVEPGSTREGALPFFSVIVFARGLPDRLYTRVYLPEAVDSIADDAFLSSLGERAATLIARRDARGDLVFDIHMQGDDETVFLEHRQKD